MILLIVGAAWMAVLLPPLMRSRFDGGSVSSVSDFSRTLRTLQRTQAPRAQAPMRSMARPLAPSPARQPRPYGAPAAYGQRRPAPQAARTSARGMQRPQTSAYGRPRLVQDDSMQSARPRRSHHVHERHHLASEDMFLSPQAVIRRRRTNVLYGLLAANGLTLFLAFTTGSTGMVYLFALAAIALVGYCYTLVQIRNQEYLRRYYGTHRAA